jgi:hypothetical protein
MPQNIDERFQFIMQSFITGLENANCALPRDGVRGDCRLFEDVADEVSAFTMG